MDNDYVSVNEAANIKGVTRQRILQYINDGRLPAQKFADVYMISRRDLAKVELKSPGRPRKKTISKAEYEQLCREACNEALLKFSYKVDADILWTAVCERVFNYFGQENHLSGDCSYKLSLLIDTGNRASESFHCIDIANKCINEALESVSSKRPPKAKSEKQASKKGVKK